MKKLFSLLLVVAAMVLTLRHLPKRRRKLPMMSRRARAERP